ncbi:hypothetical protein HI113_45850, partial [Corallococcus exiguus]|uniref:M10 family metallopeptidase C-terminal domain-containing protein n=1 Tax=Corallococcus exiguus TaxID=83462 RepID=UPI00178E4949|nr:hypothetical protein [Corallococcus exiguus]
VFTIAVANDTRDDGTGRADRIVGTASDETIAGGRGNDRLSGQGGDDVLIGGAGNDTLTGGSGKDVFTFTIKPNARTNGDKVVDFDPTRDRIAFENAVFKALGKAGKLKKAFFTISDDGKGTAKDGNDHVIYD